MLLMERRVIQRNAYTMSNKHLKFENPLEQKSLEPKKKKPSEKLRNLTVNDSFDNLF